MVARCQVGRRSSPPSLRGSWRCMAGARVVLRKSMNRNVDVMVGADRVTSKYVAGTKCLEQLLS